MNLLPGKEGAFLIRGEFVFQVEFQNRIVTDRFNLEIQVPECFPVKMPKVRELAKKVPRHADYHTYDDGTFCLATPIAFRVLQNQRFSFQFFVERCLVPHLCSVSEKLKDGGCFIFGELSHGTAGIIEDFQTFYGLKKSCDFSLLLSVLMKKNRVANKYLCPCGCRNRLGRCSFRRIVKKIRRELSPKWIRQEILPLWHPEKV